MTTTPQNSPWVLKKKAVLVYAPDLNVSCRARLRIIHDQTANQGSISLSITADLANLTGRSQVLTLNIPPDRVGKCALARKSNDNLCPSHFLSLLPAPVTNVSDVSTLSLSLELDKLENFSCALRKRSLQTVSFNHARHGVVQKDWRVFNLSPDPPPYYQESVSEQAKEADPPLYCEESVSEQSIGKRRRGSPTEVNTPSTLSPSPCSIRPTYFTHASSPSHTECKRLTRLEHELRGLSDDLIRELLIRSGRQHLLAMPKDVGRDIEKISFAEIETVERRLERHVDEMIERRLKSHVLDEIVDSAVSECRDQIYDECKTNEAEFREQVDDGNSEIRNTANECMNEIKEQARMYMLEMEEQAQQYMKHIEDQGIEVEMSAEAKVAKFKRWFNASAQSLLGSKSSTSHEPGANTRRSSI
ncbi:hypothetical protein BA78_2789 [Aspergillus fumigatus]|nr:hypothetical protein BA78_2789 [Aspergillus fumigatus]